MLASYAQYDLLAAPTNIGGLCDIGYVASFEFAVGNCGGLWRGGSEGESACVWMECTS